MMKSNFRVILCCALSSLLLVGCDDGGTAASGEKESDRRVNITATTLRSAGDAVGDDVLTVGAFKVLAWQRDSAETAASSGEFIYSDDLWVGLQEASGEYIPELVWFSGGDSGQKPWTPVGTYYWPKTFVACDFYAVYPSQGPDIEVLPRTGSKRPVRYIDFNNDEGLIDLMLAATTSNKDQAVKDAVAAGGTDGLVKLRFHHALSRITLKAKLQSDQSPQPHITLKSIQLCNVQQAGTFRFQDLPNAPGEAPLLGVWTTIGAPQNFMLYNDATGVILTEATQSLTTATMFIPQLLTAWENTTNTIAANNLLTTPGTYLKIGCSITIDGYEGEFADNGYIYIPFSATWQMNHNYEYTLHFGGGYDHEGHLILQPVTITSTITPWASGNTANPDESWL